jgi:hypothetical protein
MDLTSIHKRKEGVKYILKGECFTLKGAKMKKTICIALAIMTLVLGNALSGYAARGGHGGHGGGWNGGWHGGHGGIGFSIGPGWGPWWWGYPYYPYYYPYYPYYPTPPVAAPQEPEVYVQPESRQEEPGYWYFCKDPEGYYPYVKKCPKGWLRVVPSQPPGDEEE